MQRLIRRSWRASLVCFGLLWTALMLWLLSLGHRQEIAGQGPPPPPGGGGGGGAGSDLITPQDALNLADMSPFFWCVNYPLGNGETDCSCLIDGSAPGSNTSDGMGRPDGTCIGGPTMIDNWSFNHVHTGRDYADRSQAAGGSCQGCSGSSGGTRNPWTDMTLTRLHRTRDIGHISSFGPGVFSRFDVKLHLLDNIVDTTGTFPSTKVVDLFDPTTMYPGRFLETGPGVFEESEVNEFGNLYLYDAQGQPTSDFQLVATATLLTQTGEKLTFEIVTAGPDYAGVDATVVTSDVRDGRLTRLEDRNGYGISVAYKTWTPGELMASPERQWQIDTVTSDRGPQMTFHYDPVQVGGRWVVNQVDLPDGNSLQYSYDYTGAQLSTVTHPDGAMSTFNIAAEPGATSLSKLTINDPAAGATHSSSEVYLTNDGAYIGSDDYIVNQSSQLVRLVVNSNNEVVYFNQPDSNNWHSVIYLGEGKAMQVTPSSSAYYEDGWTFDPDWVPMTSDTPFSGTVEAGQQFTSTSITDERSILTEFELDADGWITRTIYSDGTDETTTYNSFHQPLRVKDRENRVTKFTYDSRGNRLTREIGILDDGAGGDLIQPEHAVDQRQFYPAGHASEFLLSAAIDANGNQTDYEYDTNDRLTKIIAPPDLPGGARAETVFTYDDAGRIATTTSPSGAVTTYTYDVRGRMSQIQYADLTTERFFFGAPGSGQEHLKIKQTDRRGVVTNYEYDASGRRTRTVVAAAVMDPQGNEGPVSDPSVTIDEVITYRNGSSLPSSVVRSGDRTDYGYDYRGRLVTMTRYANTQTTLTTTRTYVNNQLFSVEDPYGRRKYHAYDSSDGRLIREIQEAFSGNLADYTAVLNFVRDPDGTPNPARLVTDYVYNANGQITLRTDARGNGDTIDYDSRGRVIRKTAAAGSGAAAVTETDYDAVGNVLEVRTPRYFDSSDTSGYQKCRTVMTYTGRNLRASRTESPGTPESATETYTYDVAGRMDSRTDFRGNVWTSLYPDCCGRTVASVDPLGHGTISHKDAAGRVTHVASVSDINSHSDLHDPIDSKTHRETTTQYDERGRVVASTVWLTARGAVDSSNPPVAGEGGIPATDGQTTRFAYDDDLDDGVSLDAQFAAHLAGLNLGSDADGSARLAINAAGERTLAISDGISRTVYTAQLDLNDAALSSRTQSHDTVVTAGPVDMLETTSTNALGHVVKIRTDGNGHVIESVSSSGTTTSAYDGNGNLLSVRDPGGIGTDSVYDELDRRIETADTQQILDGRKRQTAFGASGLVIQEIDAKGAVTARTYDARGRLITTVDRTGASTARGYNKSGHLVSVTDADNQTTVYTYDVHGQRQTIQWPDHVPGTSAGDPDFGIETFEYDAVRQPVRRTDQTGATTTVVYNLAGQMITREYRTAANSPNGPVADQDSFTHDAAGRILTASKGRYSNTVLFTYNEAGQKASESLVIDGQTYVVSYGYDDAGRETTLTYPDGSVVTRDFDELDQLLQIDFAQPGMAAQTLASLSYDSSGRETTRTYGNGVVTNRAYRSDHFVTSINTVGVEDLSYGYDENGNPTSESRSGVMAPYSWSTGANGFNAEDRLTEWSRSGGDSQSWVLSSVNDWQSFTSNGTTQQRTYGPAHELLTVDGTSVLHDSRGNLIQDERGTSFTYDADNMMASFNANGVAGLSDTSYRYDAVGRRVSKTISGTPPATTVYVSAGQRVIAEYEDSSPQPTTPSRRLVFGSFIDEPIAMFSAAQPLSPIYYHTNRQQSVYSLTDDAGNVIEHVAYTPFGDHQCFASDGTPEGHIPAAGSTALFTGRDYDSESGLHYFRARSYHPGSGQFLSRDPLEYVDGPNAYHGWYAPASVDPLGLFRPGIHESITRNALGNSGLPAGCIDLIVQGNVYQDVFNLGEPRDHGDNNTIRQTIDRIRDRWNNVVTSAEFSCDPCPCFVRDMFAEFGRLLHAVQDLYSHSTYVEVNGGTVVAGGGGNAQLGQIPLWPFFNNGNNAVSGSPTPVPGTVPNVPPGVVTGTWPDFLAQPGQSHGELNKDHPGTPRGSLTNAAGMTNHELAVDVATRHSRQFWNELQFIIDSPNCKDAFEKCCTEPEPLPPFPQVPPTFPGIPPSGRPQRPPLDQ